MIRKVLAVLLVGLLSHVSSTESNKGMNLLHLKTHKHHSHHRFALGVKDICIDNSSNNPFFVAGVHKIGLKPALSSKWRMEKSQR